VNDGRDGRGVDVDVDADDGHGRADGDGGDAAGGDGGNGDVLPRRWRRATAAQTHEATLRGGRRGAAQYFWESTHVETLFHLTLKIDLVSPCFLHSSIGSLKDEGSIFCCTQPPKKGGFVHLNIDRQAKTLLPGGKRTNEERNIKWSL
jgi:hypothetical protein